jgi:hypothetical protein
MGALARHDSGDLHELNPKETSATKSWAYSPSRLSVLCLLAASAPGAPPLAELRDNAQIRCCRGPAALDTARRPRRRFSRRSIAQARQLIEPVPAAFVAPLSSAIKDRMTVVSGQTVEVALTSPPSVS